MKRYVTLCCLVGALAFGDRAAAQQWPDEFLEGPAIDGAGGVVHEGLMRFPGARAAAERGAVRVELEPLPDHVREMAHDAGDDSRTWQGPVLPIGAAVMPEVRWQQTDAGGRVWAVELHQMGVAGMRVKLAGRWGEDGVELRVYDPVGGHAFGPYTRPRLNEHGEWWTTIIFGEAIGLEFHAPADVVGELRVPDVVSVGYFLRPMDFVEENQGTVDCGHDDVTCAEQWANSARAVCRIAFTTDDGNAMCTAALLNRQPSDFSPLLLTAEHCISNQAEAESVCAFWFFQTDVCDGAEPNLNTVPRSDGTLLLKRRLNTDMSFLGLYEPPAGDVWLGWHAGGWLLQSDAVGIHHPAGTFKRISEGNVTAALWVIYGKNNAHVWRVHWDSGSTEGGSSGSPVLDSQGRVRGQLKGGPGCGVGDYGRFGISFGTLEPFIYNMASPIHVDGSHGGTEKGTSSEPFRLVHRASYCVFAGDEVRIKAGSYDETFTIWRPMTLTAEDGLVRIGQQ